MTEMRHTTKCGLPWVAVLLLAAAAPAAQAQNPYHVSMDLSSLFNSTSTTAPYYFDFTLTDGDGVADAFAHVCNFSLTGATLGPELPPTIGDVQDNLPGGELTLTDSAGTADVARAFFVSSASSTVNFDLTLTADTGGSSPPDSFVFRVLDQTASTMPTNGPGGIELVRADYDNPFPVPQGYSTVSPAPSLTAVVTPNGAPCVPEPVFLQMGSLLGLGGIVMLRARVSRRSA